MRIFCLNILIFSVLITTVITFLLFSIPNDTAQNSLLGALPDKHQMLREAGSPKIVFIGGSNLSFGLDSKIIHEHLKLPVVNAGLHAGIGLKYCAKDVLPYINNGDILVLSPEYQHFYTDLFYGDIELVSILFDVFEEGRKYIDIQQWFHLVQIIPRYAIAKLKFRKTPQNHPVGIYSRKSFNEYGDAYIHWSLPRTKIDHAKPSTENDVVNFKSIQFLKNFSLQVKSKKATLVILPPVYASTSYNNQQQLISEIRKALTVHGLPFAAEPIRYKFADTLFFNTNYHLTKRGVDIRTKMVIEDLSRIEMLINRKKLSQTLFPNQPHILKQKGINIGLGL